MYGSGLSPERGQMTTLLKRFALRTLYQSSVALGITLMPLALVMQRAGLRLPVHRLVNRFGEAYARSR